MEDLSPVFRTPTDKKGDGKSRQASDNDKGKIKAAPQNLTQM